MTRVTLPEIVRIGEASRILGVSIETLRNWDKWGKLKPMRTLTRNRIYRTADLERLLQEREKHEQ